jgi:UDP-glucose 4-epimerase
MKHILVTGGAGFLGSHVVHELLQAGHRVRVVDDFSTGKEMHLAALRENPLLSIVRGDITLEKDIEPAFEDIEVVIHLAVLSLRHSIRDPLRVAEVIGRGTLNCLLLARERGVELFLNCSSSEVYGSAVRAPMDEDHPLNPETPYAAAKAAQDFYVRSFGETFGLPWVTVRPFNMYGPNSHWEGPSGELIPKMIVRAMNGKKLQIYGDGMQTRDFLFVQESARAFLAVMSSPACWGTCYNLCTGVETSVLEIAQALCEAFHLDPKETLEWVPSRPGDVRRHLGDSTRIRSRLGLSFDVTLREGILTTVDWFRSLPLSPEDLLSQEVEKNWE